jgi:GNAT superfamily N-acetyltransferase
MNISIREETVRELERYGEVPMIISVESRYRVEPIERGLGGWLLVEDKVNPPYEKDYDEDGGPARWPKHGDISTWGVFSAYDGSLRVGGAVVAWNTPWLHVLEARQDLAALWDIRIHPDYRRRGIGSKLLNKVEEWARQRRCKRLKVETQNINVAACRFYAHHGYALRAVHPRAYPEHPEEIQLLWFLDL